MATAFSYLPAVLSLLLLGAHFLRDGHVALVAASLAPLALVFVPRPWAARALQLILVVAALEWVRTLTELALQRAHAGLPWLRMAIILGTVAALALLGAWLFQGQRLGARHGLRPASESTPRGWPKPSLQSRRALTCLSTAFGRRRSTPPSSS